MTVTGSAGQIAPAPAHAISFKENWADDWEVQDMAIMSCDWFEFAAGPEFDKAQLSWRYGIGFPYGSAEQEIVAPWPTTIKGWYVKIVVDHSATNFIDADTWYGRIVELHDEQAGVLTGVGDDGPIPVPSGRQKFVCFGLGYELDKVTILTSQVVDPDDSDSPKVLKRSIGWNLGQGWDERDHGDIIQGNRSKTQQYQSTYVFAKDLTAANSAKWETMDIAKYLLLWYSAQNGDGTRTLPWQVLSTGGTNPLAGYQHRLRGQGRTTWKVLNDLLDRRRGVGVHVVLNVGDGPDGTDAPVLVIHSLASSTITFPDSSQLLANANTVSLDTSGDPWLETCDVRTSEVCEYDQVVVRGNRRGSVFTISRADATMAPDWTDAQQTKWNTGFSADPEYSGPPALSDEQKRLRNDEVRAQTDLERVFSYYCLAADWNGFVADGIGGETTAAAFPALDDSGNATSENIRFWVPGLRFEHHLPLTTDVDYSGDHVANGTAIAAPPTDLSLAEHMPMLVVARLYDIKVDGTQDTTFRYFQLDRMAVQGAMFGGQGLPRWSAGSRPQQNAPGLVLKVHGAERRCGNVLIAKEEYDPPDGADKMGMPVASGDIPAAQAVSSQSIIVTVYVKMDEYVEIRQPPDSDLDETTGIRQLMIHVHDAYLDWIVDKTVVGIDNHGHLLRTSPGGFIRDDRPRLTGIAQLAAAWYLQPRSVVTLVFKRIWRYCRVGDMITTVGNSDLGTLQTVNTVVSRVRYDLAGSRTTIQTSHGELDLNV